MSEDLTKKLPQTDRDTILIAIKNLEAYVRGSVDNLVTWISSVDSRLRGLEQTVEERLYDTRPIWHKVVADICEIQTGQKRLEQSQSAMREQVIELNSVVRTINRDQIVINDVIRQVHLDFHTLDERLHRFLTNRNSQNSST